MNIGEKIKNRRLEINLSQKELAKDICSQAEISRIESDATIPNSQVLFNICNRLNVTMNYFYFPNNIDNIDSKYIYEDLLNKKDYQTLYLLTKDKLKNRLSKFEFLYFTWLNSMCTFYCTNNNEKPLQNMTSILKAFKNDFITTINENGLKHQEIQDPLFLARIYYSLGILYQSTNNSHVAKRHFKSALQIIKNYDINERIVSNLYYSLASIYYNEKKYIKCIESANIGIVACIKYDTFYNYEYFCYIIVESKNKLNDINNEDINLLQTAHMLAKQKADNNLIKSIKSLKLILNKEK